MRLAPSRGWAPALVSSSRLQDCRRAVSGTDAIDGYSLKSASFEAGNFRAVFAVATDSIASGKPLVRPVG